MKKTIYTYEDLLVNTEGEQKWYVPRFLPEGAVTLLAGEAGSGKSFLALDLAIAVATGRSAWHPTTNPPLRVLYFCQDSSRFNLAKRVQALAARLTAEEKTHLTKNLAFNFNAFTMGGKVGMSEFATQYQTHLASLIVIDVLARYLPNMSDSNIASIGPSLNFLSGISDAEMFGHHISFLILHHLNKRAPAGAKSTFYSVDGPTTLGPDQSRVRGSSDIVANVDLVWGLRKSEGKHILSQLKNRLSAQELEQPAFQIQQQGSSVQLAYEILSAPTPKHGVEEFALQGLLAILQENPGKWFTRQELITALEERQGLPGQRRLSDAFSELGKVDGISLDYTRNGRMYQWKEDSL